jgi:hypothetical protein
MDLSKRWLSRVGLGLGLGVAFAFATVVALVSAPRAAS